MLKCYKVLYPVACIMCMLSLHVNAFAAPMPTIPVELQQKISLVVLDSAKHKTIYDYNPDTPRLVASNMKLITTWIALQVLHPDFKWHTKLFYHGDIIDHVIHGDVYIQGGGDPTFTRADLYSMLSQLKRIGVREITGNIIIDEHIFNTTTTYSMLQVEKYDSDIIMPSGLMVDGDQAEFSLHINANKVSITPNLYQYTIDNHLMLDTNKNTCATVYKDIAVNVHGNNILFSGAISAKCEGKVLIYKMLDHQAYTAMMLNMILHDFGIRVDGGYSSTINKNTIPSDAVLLSDHESLSLGQIVYTMNHYSMNLFAESLLLSLGAYTTNNSNTYQQAKAVYLAFLSKLNIPQFKLENGAGLSRHEFITANMLAQLLWVVNSSPLQAVFQASLPVSGEDGSLQKKFIEFGNHAQFKTGTLNDTRSFSGYFYAKNGKKYIVIAIANDLINTPDKNEHDIFENFVHRVLFTIYNQ